jgi:heme/copper-type cytochrome/quinol oxidase subunit 1
MGKKSGSLEEFIASAIAWLPSITECYFDPKLLKRLPQITVLGCFLVMFRLQCTRGKQSCSRLLFVFVVFDMKMA